MFSGLYKSIQYKPEEFSCLPHKINQLLDECSNNRVLVHVEGHPTSDETERLYCRLMDKFDLCTVFYPYSEAFPNANIAIGRKNPLAEIKLFSQGYVDAVRFINAGWMIFDSKRIGSIRFNEDLKVRFLDDFFDRCAQRNLLPSNGIFIDVHNSWNYFQRYRLAPITINKKDFDQESEKLNINLDGTTQKILKRVYEHDKMYGGII